jgi:hypothetical protein
MIIYNKEYANPYYQLAGTIIGFSITFAVGLLTYYLLTMTFNPNYLIMKDFHQLVINLLFY